MARLTVGSTWTVLLPGLLLIGLGIGLANPAIARIALGVVPPQRTGMASGISNTFRIGGLSIGVAALGAIFQQQLSSGLQKQLGRAVPGLARDVASGGIPAVKEGHGSHGGFSRAARIRHRHERAVRGRSGRGPCGSGGGVRHGEVEGLRRPRVAGRHTEIRRRGADGGRCRRSCVSAGSYQMKGIKRLWCSA